MTSSIWTQRLGGEPFTDAERRQAAIIASGVWRGLAKWSLLVGAVWLFVLLAACSGGATGPKGIDPTVLITNQLPDTVYFTWRDGQGIVGNVSVAPGASSCTRFLAQADSAYFEAHATSGGGQATYTQPWFDPATRNGWTMKAFVGQNNPVDFLVVDTSPNEPC
jgi:hypothetical protein